MPGSEAERKFWRSPELVEGLLHFLDPTSLLQLGQAHQLTIGILQGTYNWSRFIRRSCPHPTPEPLRFEERIEPIIGILQTIGNPHSHLMELLEFICESCFPLDSTGDPFGPQYVKVTCSTHGDHVVSPLGFQLLELVEAATGSSELKIESVLIGYMKESLIQALKSRVMRQEGMISQVDAWAFICRSQDDAEALLTLVQSTEVFGFRRLGICGPIGKAGWAALAEALRVLPPLVLQTMFEQERTGFQAMVVSGRQLMLDGRREDVRAVWDALPVGSHLLMVSAAEGHMLFDKVAEEDWDRLELYLDNENPVEAQNEDPEN